MTTCPLPPSTRVYGYTRDSGGGDQEMSIPQQVAELRSYAAEHDLVLVRIFKDEARQGSTTVGRDQFEALLAASRRTPPEAQAILLWSYSRFARDFNDAAFFKADLRRRGWEIHSISDPVPPGEFAPIMEAIIDWTNERFLKGLSADVKRALHDMATKGYTPGGFPPRGYKAEHVEIGKRRDGKPRIVARWVEDPETGPLARLAWQMRAEGRSYTEIQETVGLYKSASCWASFFQNRTYLGILKCGDEEFPGAIPALVDQATWDRVQAMRRKAKRQQRPPEVKAWRVKSPFLLSGIIYCGRCGSAMRGGRDMRNTRRGGEVWSFYVCGRKDRQGWQSCESAGKFDARRLEAAVLRTVIEKVLTPEAMTQMAHLVNGQLSRSAEEAEEQVALLDHRIKGLDQGIGHLLEVIERVGVGAGSATLERLEAREQERAKLLQQRRELEALRRSELLTVSPQLLSEVLTSLHEQLHSEDVAVARSALQSLVLRIEVTKGQATLFYTLPDALLRPCLVVPPRGFEPLSQA